MSFKPTEEQEAIRERFKDGEALTITARAGAGKTATLRLLAKDHAPKKAIYLAFNRAIKEEAEGTFPDNTKVVTTHGLAWRSFIDTRYFNRIPQPGRSRPRMPSWKLAKWLRARGVDIDDDRSLSPDVIARITKATVDKFCNSDADEPDTQHVIQAVRGLPNLDDPMAVSTLKRVVVPYAQRMWADLVSDTGELTVDHSHYLKRWANSNPRIAYDLILFDEAQDTNPVILQVLGRQSHAQIVAVGDRAQQLYAWRGAIDAMDQFGGNPLALSKSFRFGDAIAAQANTFLTLLEDSPPVVGFEEINSQVIPELDGRAPNMVLCRTNAGVLKSAIEQHQAGRSVAIVGGGDTLKTLAQDVEKLQEGKRPKSDELMAFKNYQELRTYAENEAPDMMVLIKLIESHGTQEIVDFVGNLSHEEFADVRVSTAHKAKGLEAPTVLVAEDFYKEPKPDQGDAVVLSRADAMLLYVTVTRAQRLLALGGLRYLNEFPVVISGSETIE